MATSKPQNVYVHSKLSNRVACQPWKDRFAPITKIGDLGIASEVGMLALGYTPDYSAPEQHGSGPMSAAADIFSVGQTLAALIVGKPFNRDELKHKKRLKECFTITIPSAYLVERITEIVRSMTWKTPTLRPSAIDAARKLQKVVDHELDWTILRVFSRFPDGLTISEAGEKLFYEVASAENWRNIRADRVKRMKDAVRSSKKRGLLSLNGHTYSIRRD